MVLICNRWNNIEMINFSDNNNRVKIAPHSPKEFSSIFREANFKRSKLSIRGFSTQGPVPPERVEVCTIRLNSITAGFPGDLILRAGTGSPFKKLKQYIPDLPDYSGTIGGFLCGSLVSIIDRLKLTQRVLKLTYIRPTGEIVGLGSLAVKDVAGFRIAHLLFSSQGRLGLITEVVINSAPLFRGYELYPHKSVSIVDNPPLNYKFVRRILDQLDPNEILN
jgi:FAD/FMN-containing dehydrogenase